MNKPQNFRHLQVVAAVARYGGVRKAADRVNLSQPATSAAISRVEDVIGETLFDRLPQGMIPTEAGQLFVQRINRALGYLKSGAHAIAAHRATRGWHTPLLERPATTVQLRALVEVAEHGGYARAARHLGVTEPNVHRAIRDLERVAGRKLFQPSPFGAAPTAEGLIFARWVNLAFREIDQGLDELRELRGIHNGSIVIGSLPLLRTTLIPIAVTRLLTDHPDARVRIVDGPYDELLHRLQHGHIDLIVGALRIPAPANDLRQEELFQELLSIAVRAGHPILKSGTIDAKMLADLDWIAPSVLTPAGAQFAAFFRRHGFPLPKRVIECSSFITTRDLLVRGDRAALLSTSQIQQEALAGELAMAVTSLPGTERPIGLCMRLDWSPTMLQNAFLSLVRMSTRSSTETRSS